MSSVETMGKLMRAGVIGHPINHSLSPLLHNAWIAAGGFEGVYRPYPAPIDGFENVVKELRAEGLRGLNVTLPFKEAALRIADEASPMAVKAGAANLLLFRDGRILAQNTDGDGLLYAFARQAPGLDLSKGPATILGAGGAARGAVAALGDAGVSDIRVVNRTLSRAEQLAADFPKVSAFATNRMQAALDGTGAIINATSAEVAGGALQLDFRATPPDAVAMDMMYRPLKTRFLTEAEQHGLKTVDGLDMLIGQAIPSFRALFGRSVPESVDARALLLNALSQAS